ncbi:hypothetical protein [Thermaerobacter litoralis]
MHPSHPSRTGQVPWEPGDRWLRPLAIPLGPARAAGSRVPAPGTPPAQRAVGAHTITYLVRLADAMAEAGPAQGTPADAAPAVPRVLLAPAPAGAVAPLWGRVLQGVMVRDPGHLRQLVTAAGPRTGTRWVLLPWDGTPPALWARGWARVTEWAPGAAGPVIVPVLPGGPAGAGRPVSQAAAVRPGLPAPGDGLAALARARRELLRHLEEPVPAPVVLPAGAGIDAPARREAGLEGVPVWWWTGGAGTSFPGDENPT